MTRFFLKIFFCSGVVVFVSVIFWYTQKTRFVEEVLAQRPELVCSGPEIPVGTLIDEADKFHKAILTSLFQISSAARAQIEESEILMGVERLCKAGDCTSSCQKICVRSNLSGCIEWACRTNSCTGDPLPCKAQAASRYATVESHYQQVKNANDAIKDILTKKIPAPSSLIKNCPATCGGAGGAGQACTQKCSSNTVRTHIMNALAEVRRAMQACVTPVNQGTSEEEIVQRTDAIYSCQEAKSRKVLTDTQQQCATNNFFCCSLQVVK